MDKDLIEKWVSSGLITASQAETMKMDIRNDKKKRGSQNLITTLSSIGALLIGIGLIVFIASNWSVIPDLTKMLLVTAVTFSTLLLGYFLRYASQTFPRVGEALVFLSSLFFGGNIFLIAQIYHVTANNHWLILLWLLGVLPMTYALRTQVLATLSATLFYVWLGFFALRSLEFNEASVSFLGLPVLVLNTSIFIYMLGSLHFLYSGLEKIGRLYRLGALQIGLLCLFLLTFQEVSGAVNITDYTLSEILPVLSQFNITVLIFSVFAACGVIIYRLLNPTKSSSNIWETGIALLLLVLSLAMLYTPRTTDLFTYVFNMAMIAILYLLFYYGYLQHNLRAVNIASMFSGLYIIAKYADFFWEMLPKSLFFTLGGIILLPLSLFFERQLRQARVKFKDTTDPLIQTPISS